MLFLLLAAGAVIRAAAPARLYMYGDVNTGWEELANTTPVNNKFTFNLTVSKEKGYITFCSGTIAVGGNWAVQSGCTRYGYTSEVTISTGTAYNMSAGSDKCWVVPAGKYNVVADFSQNTPKVTFTADSSGGGDADFYTPAHIYLHGTFDNADWQFNEEMTKEDKTFSITKEMTKDENIYITLTDTSCNGAWNFPSGYVRYGRPGSQGTITSGVVENFVRNDNCYIIPNSGTWTITMTFTSANNGTLTFTKVGEDEEDPTELAPATLYISGAFTGEAWDYNIPMEKNGNSFSTIVEVKNTVHYQLYAAFSSGQVTIDENGDWKGYGSRYGFTGSSQPMITSGEEINFKSGSDKCYQLPRSGRWEVNVTFTTKNSGHVTFTRIGDIEGVVDPEPDPDETDLYIIGNINPDGWTNLYSVYPVNHKYTFSITVENEIGYITFCTSKINFDNNWSYASGETRYGSGSSDLDAVSGTKYTLNAGSDKCWHLAPGTYNVVADFSQSINTVTFTLVEEEDPIDPENPYAYNPANGVKSSLEPTGTLPVLYINTADVMRNRDLKDKTYRVGEYWLDTKGLPQYAGLDLGTAEEPLTMQIKARGNFTRTGFSKKPYKLKLDSKQSMLGLTKSKHFALLAHADDEMGFLRNFVGFNLGKRIGLPWTPQEQPIELVINGDYRGIYFLTESIRVDKDRINITELEDNEEDNTLCSGGYLVELDNYEDENTIKVGTLKITPDTPELYSSIQTKFVTEQFTTMNNLVNSHSNDLWSYLDLDAAARYYVVMEIISHWEAYHGSTYLYRDRGEGKKWVFSPLWDCGNAFPSENMNDYKSYFTDHAQFGNDWIGSLRMNGKFMDKVKESFSWFLNSCYANLTQDIDNYIANITAASMQDAKRWKDEPLPQQYNDPLNANYPTNPSPVRVNEDIENDKNIVKDALKTKVDWLKGVWSYRSDIVNEPAADTTEPAELPLYVTPDYNPKARQVTVYYQNTNMNANSDVRIWAWTNEGGDLFAPLIWATRPKMPVALDDYRKYYASYTIDIPSTDVDYDLHIIITFGGDTKVVEVTNPEDGDLFKGTSTTPIKDYEPHIKYHSETLPHITITTENGVAIEDTETEITATLKLDPCNTDAAEVSQSGTIRGRGTTTWNDFAKKPYKLKLDSKVSFGGMPVSKHWLLLPWAADSDLAMLRNVVGNELSRRIGLAWTPGEYPVELTINGEYLGIYFIVENIRPAAERVQVADISDYKGTPDMPEIWNDWIIELDNTVDEETADFTAHGGSLRFVTDSPAFTNKNLTEESRIAIKERLNDLIDAIYDNSRWMDIERLLDVEEAARYFIVQELMDDANAYHTGCFLTISGINDGPNAKFKFGPVWDFSKAFGTSTSGTGKTAMTHERITENNFLATLYSRQEFYNVIVKEYCRFMGYPEPVLPETQRRASAPARAAATESGTYADMKDYITRAAAAYAQAGDKDAAKWPENNVSTQNINASADQVAQYLEDNKTYLDNQWKELIQTSVSDIYVDQQNVPAEYYDVTGCRIYNPIPGTVIIVKQGTQVTKRIAADATVR